MYSVQIMLSSAWGAVLLKGIYRWLNFSRWNFPLLKCCAGEFFAVEFTVTDDITTTKSPRPMKLSRRNNHDEITTSKLLQWNYTKLIGSQSYPKNCQRIIILTYEMLWAVQLSTKVFNIRNNNMSYPNKFISPYRFNGLV